MTMVSIKCNLSLRELRVDQISSFMAENFKMLYAHIVGDKISIFGGANVDSGSNNCYFLSFFGLLYKELLSPAVILMNERLKFITPLFC